MGEGVNGLDGCYGRHDRPLHGMMCPLYNFVLARVKAGILWRFTIDILH